MIKLHIICTRRATRCVLAPQLHLLHYCLLPALPLSNHRNFYLTLTALRSLACPFSLCSPFSKSLIDQHTYSMYYVACLRSAASLLALPPPTYPPSSNFSLSSLAFSLSNYLALTDVSSFSLCVVHLSTAASLVALPPPACPPSSNFSFSSLSL